jgi:hypothetical protein
MMNVFRKFFYFIVLPLIIVSCAGGGDEEKLPANLIKNPMSASDKKSEKDLPAISFEKTTHDYGRLIQGEKVSYAFKFSNTGTADLIISNVSASCGCTVPGFSRYPIKPGETGTINVVFDSHNRRGFQNKTVTVLTNTQPNKTILNVKATIVVPERS